MTARLSRDDLARLAGVEPADVARWTEMQLLAERDGGYAREDVERARLLAFAATRGIGAEVVAEACRRDSGLLDRFVRFVAHPDDRPRSLEEGAAEAGVDPAFVRRMRAVSGLSLDELYDDDVVALRAAGIALQVGFGEDALLQLVRVLADALGRVADAEVRLFHFHFHDRLRAEGHTDEEIGRATDAAAEALLGLLDPTVVYFHRKSWEAALREDMLGHFAEQVASPDAPVGRLPVAVLFVDLAGYTPLTEALGDVAAADVVDRFSVMVREEAAGCAGRLVKQIGDEFMLAFKDADAAAAYAVRLARRAAAEPAFPALRMGAHYGDAIYREADYLGATVNVAARVTGQAQRGQLLVTRPFRDALRTHAGLPMTDAGERVLKGVGAPVALYAVDAGAGAVGD